jgi:subtilisin family serine protease
MRIAQVVPSLLALSGLVAARSFRRSDNETLLSEDAPIAAKKFIIEIDHDTDKDEVVKMIESTKGTRVLKLFDSAVFKGISVESDSLNTDALQSIQSVVKAWHATRITLPPVIQGKGFSDDAAAPKYQIHDMTGVDRLHKEGIFGKGVKIGIVDTGLDYNHPDVRRVLPFRLVSRISG